MSLSTPLGSLHIGSTVLLLLLPALVALQACPSLAQTCPGASCVGSVQLVQISPAECAQPSSCDFLCAQSYSVVQVGTAGYVLPLLPETTCQCAVGIGTINNNNFVANFTDGTYVVGGSNGTNLLIRNSLGCRSVYSVTTGSVFGLQGPPQTAAGAISLVSISPAECFVPTSCNYRCAIGYAVLQNAATATVTSLLAPGDCPCLAGSGTVSGTSGTIEFPDGSVAKASVSGSSIAISTSESGITCSANYELAAGSVLGVQGTAAWSVGSIVLQSVSPDACNEPQSCYYICALNYTVAQTGSQAQVVPGAEGPCNCAHGVATVSGTSAAVAFSDGSTAQAAAAGATISITSQVLTLTCTGTYAVVQGTVLGISA